MQVKCPAGRQSPAECPLLRGNPEGLAFCDECGEPLKTAVAPVSAAPDAAVQAVAPVTTHSEPVVQTAHAVPAEPVAHVAQAAPAESTEPAAHSVPPEPVAPPVHAAPAEPVAPVIQAVPAEPEVTVAPVTSEPRLIVEANNQEFDLSGKDTITIGREDPVSNLYPDIDLTPYGGEEGGVSRMHARILLKDGQYMLEDENSTNHTFINRQRIEPATPVPIHNDDEIRLGRVVLRFKV